MTKRPPTDQQISFALRCAVIGVGLVVAGFLLGVLVGVSDDAVSVDRWWNAAVAGFFPASQELAYLLNTVGGGIIATYVVPLSVAAILLILRRPWSALLFLLGSAISAGVVQLLKSVFGRVRPEEILVVSDHGSFPSGHAANAATIAVLAVVIVPRLWVAVVGMVWTALMALGRTQLHAHWLSDTIGGILIGAGAAFIVVAILAVPVLRERERRAAARGGGAALVVREARPPIEPAVSG